MAAFAVCAGHTRNVWFVSHPELERSGGLGDVAASAFYALTGYGYQAVIVFFVLSGFFIGQAVVSRHRPGSTWSWGHYLIDRTSRLHIVLLPALVLTLAADMAGSSLMPTLYAGDYPGGLLPPGLTSRLTPEVFLLNNLYLQNIAGPTYGSNAPLWSLAYELWFYLLFPLLVRGFLSTRTGERITSAALFVVAGLIAGEGVMWSFPIWLLGAAIAYIKPTDRFERVRRYLPWLTGGLLAAVLLATRAWVWPAEDFVLGVACALWVLSVVASPRATEPATHRLWHFGTRTAAFSYSLYAIHLPLVFLVRAALGEHMANGGRNQLDAVALVSYTLVLIGIVLLSWCFGHLTEAQTPTLRRWLRQAFRLGPTHSA